MNTFTKHIFLIFIFAGSLSAGLMKDLGFNNISFKKLPQNFEAAINEIIDSANPKTNITISAETLKVISDFVIKNANDGKAWLPKERREAKGAALINSYNIPFDKTLEINLAADVPDAALFYKVLRYSKKINLSQQTKKFFIECAKRFPTNKIAKTSYYSIESITPNIQSGAYYSYTNLRAITRANINGIEMLVSISDMIAPSDFSMRGAPVGPVEDGLFYYSQRPGLNLPGVSWAKSQMYLSSTLVVYLETPEKNTAVAMVSWQRAGWKGMNIIKSHHIYSVLQDTLSAFNSVFGNKNVTLKNIHYILNKVNKMNAKNKNNLYSKYRAYVMKWLDIKPKGLNPFRKSVLAKVFNDKSLDNMKNDFIDILIVQEYVRELIGKPTWSVTPPLKPTK